METAERVGRTVGVLLFFQLAGLIVPFILLLPLTTASIPTDGAQISFLVRLAVMLLFTNAALTLVISLIMFRIVREHSPQWALALVAVSTIWIVMQAVDNTQILSMLSIRERVAGGPASLGILDALSSTIATTRRWVHYTELLVIDMWFVLFYYALWKCALVPRLLPAFGVAMAVVHTFAIPIPVFLGYASVQALGVSLALSHMIVGAWLLTKGFTEPVGNAPHAVK